MGTHTATQAIQILMSIPSKTFAEVNKALGIKIISKAGEKTLLNITKIMPGIGSIVQWYSQCDVMINAYGRFSINAYGRFSNCFYQSLEEILIKK